MRHCTGHLKYIVSFVFQEPQKTDITFHLTEMETEAQKTEIPCLWICY